MGLGFRWPPEVWMMMKHGFRWPEYDALIIEHDWSIPKSHRVLLRWMVFHLLSLFQMNTGKVTGTAVYTSNR